MSIFKYKQTGRMGLFDKEATSTKLSKLGNPLEKLHKIIDFEMFRIELEDNLLNHDKKSNAGCKPYDVVLMFKIIRYSSIAPFVPQKHACKGITSGSKKISTPAGSIFFPPLPSTAATTPLLRSNPLR